MSATRGVLLVGLALFAAPVACTCDPGGSDDSGVDAGGASDDAGSDGGATIADAGRDAGVDGGATDAGRIDAGADAGAADAGRPDAGADSGTPDAGRPDAGDTDGGVTTTCAMLECPRWQSCVDGTSGARCTGGGTITWVSPVASAIAPLDLISIPLAIDTTLGSTIDVPWSASGVIRTAGVFSGQQGVRSAALLFPDSDGGPVVLTAGWDGGPTATTSFQVGPPVVKLPPPPARTNTVDFEPNDPAGPAFRRDDVVAIELDALPPPMALHARLDVPMAQTLSVPIVDRCDAGTCFHVDLRLRDVDFPAFRGRVFVWASGADGGMQTRPHSIPVTRWRWRRQVSGVPNPLRVTRAVSIWSNIFVGSEDTPGTGRFLTLSTNGTVLTTNDPVYDQNTFGVVTIAGSSFTAFNTSDGGFLYGPYSANASVPFRVVSAGMSDDTMLGLAGDGTVSFTHLNSNLLFPTCSSSGSRFVSMLPSEYQAVLFREAGPLCAFDPYGVPLTFASTIGSYLPRYLPFQSGRPMAVMAAGVDGGLWSIIGSSVTSLVETLRFDGGLVDAVGSSDPVLSTATGYQFFWVNADRSVQRADLANNQGSVPSGTLSNISRPSSQLIPARTASAPLILFNRSVPNPGAMVVVDSSGALSSFDLSSLELRWVLPGGDGGVRGRVDSDPIYLSLCSGPRLGSMLIASSGDGSLYSFVGDLESLPPHINSTAWPMGGGNSENLPEDSVNQCSTQEE